MNEYDKKRNGGDAGRLNAIVYCRAASASADKDLTLLSQELRCRAYSAGKRYRVAKVVHDCPASGARFGRAGVRDVFQYLARENAPGRYIVIVDDFARLGRGVDASRDFRQALDAAGAQLECRDGGIGPDSDHRHVAAMRGRENLRGPKR
jgi:DNA invertase Pin-like site-specific DNA recombinase